MTDDKKCDDCAKKDVSAIYDLIRNEIRTIEDEVRTNREGLNRRISERIPIKHAITGIIITVGIITTIITVFSNGVGRVEDKIDGLSERVAVMTAVNEERKHQLKFQERLLEVLIESLEEKNMVDGGPGPYPIPYGKPGP